MTPSRTDMTLQLPPRLPEAQAEIARTLAAAHEADVAEALSRMDPAAAAEVLSAFPFDFPVRVLEHPEFERRHEAFRHFATDTDVTFIRGHVARPTGPPSGSCHKPTAPASWKNWTRGHAPHSRCCWRSPNDRVPGHLPDHSRSRAQGGRASSKSTRANRSSLELNS